tara:strand:- start:244 stop:606 length:363 start_codon:yes stop_codon:yes gene_type:complete
MKMIEVLLFILCSTVLAGGAFALMFSNLRDINKYNSERRPMDKKPENPLSDSNHPEVKEIKGDEELLVVNFEKDTRDPLNRSLQDRIDALNNGADGDNFDDWDDDEDDDDDGGDVIVVRR